VTTYVIDANIAAKLLLPESDSALAEQLATRGAVRLLAPDLIRVELAHVIAKQFRRRALTRAQAEATFDAAAYLPIQLRTSAPLLTAAMRIALETQCAVYDAVYVAVAVAQGAVLVTADLRLISTLRATSLAPSVCSLAEA
jgi:predicted nucleic acid-binding protein